MAHGNKVNAAREYYVCKSNELIQKGRYNLSTTQQKIVLYAISKIKKNDDPNTLYELSIDELCSVCGFNISGGSYYQNLKQDMRRLASPVWVQFDDHSEWLISWFRDVGIVPLSGTVYVRFHEKIFSKTFLFPENSKGSFKVCPLYFSHTKEKGGDPDVIRNQIQDPQGKEGHAPDQLR